jgi:small-conductance mechanosensitive channel
LYPRRGAVRITPQTGGYPDLYNHLLGRLADYYIMNYLERSDAKFVTQATDESERQAAIERFSGARRWMFWTAILMSALFLFVFILGARHPTFGAVGAAIGLGFGSVMSTVNFMKCESDLRLLKVVERLRR